MAKVEAKVTFLSYQYKNILVCNSVMEINSQVMVHSWIQYSKNIAGTVFKIMCILKVNLVHSVSSVQLLRHVRLFATP